MKKLLLSAVLGLLLLGACAGQETASPAAPAEPTVLEFWHALGGDLGRYFTVFTNEFNAMETHFQVKEVIIGSYDELNTALHASFAAGIPPQIIAGGDGHMFHRMGLVEPLEPHLSDEFHLDDILGGLMAALTIDGQMVFAPAYATSQILYFNKLVLEESGHSVEDLSSWQTLVAMAPNVMGISTGEGRSIQHVWKPMSGVGNMVDAVQSAGGSILSADGLTATVNSEYWFDVLESFRGWLHDESIMGIHVGGQGWEFWYRTMDDWVYGLALGYTGSPGDYIIALDAVREAIDEGIRNEFGMTVQPGWRNNPPRPSYSALLYFLPRTGVTENYAAAARFVEYTITTENTARFAIATGYVPVRRSVLYLEAYQEFLENNPYADIPLIQVDRYAVPQFIDPTGGAIWTVLADAIAQIQVENAPVQATLDNANERIQRELDRLD